MKYSTIWSLPVKMVTTSLAIVLSMPPIVYAAKPEDKGKDHAPGQERREEAQQQQEQRAEQAAERAEARAEQAQARSEQRAEARSQAADVKAEQAAIRAEARTQAAEIRQERQQDRRLEAESRRGGNERANERRHEPSERNENARVQVASLVDSLNKLDHARWSHNPYDTRGQGNLGKPRMQDPFGFDKDSGRMGQDRGRPIRSGEPEPAPEEPPVVEEPPVTEPPAEEPAPTLNLAEDLMTSLSVTDPYVLLYQSYILWYQQISDALYAQYASSDPAYADYLVEFYAQTIANTEQLIRDRIAEVEADTSGYWADIGITAQPDQPLMVDDRIDAMAYTLGLQAPDTFSGTTLQVTTTLTAIGDQDVVTWDLTQPGWDPFETINQFEDGQVVWQATEDVTLSADGTAYYAYNLPIADAFANDLTGYGGEYIKLTVTVTDPATDQTYVASDDRLRIYRCPYGIVYDKRTGKAIAGATVTVHNEDGSVVLLEKASNPNVSNPQTTDATGRYNCKLAIGKKYYLSVKAPGYQEYKSQLFSERWHIVREDVALMPQSSQSTGARLPVETADGLMVPAVSPSAHPVK